jgi:uncharacterized protein YcfL
MVVKKKHPQDMTFKEFYMYDQKGVTVEAVENEKREILEILREQGFSEQQVNEMKMKAVLTLMFDAADKILEDVKATVFRNS